MSPDGGTLHVLTGPSGVGKDVVLAELVRLGDDYHLPVTATTRSPRPGERDGVDYSFVSVDRFRQMIDGGEMIEWAEVYGNYYGVPAHEVDDALAAGRNVILKVDVQGARTIRDARPDAVLVFLAPPDLPTLERRLRGRSTETGPELEIKLREATQEIEASRWFDHVVINHEGQARQAALDIHHIVRGR